MHDLELVVSERFEGDQDALNAVRYLLMLQEGKSKVEIAEAFGIHRATLNRWESRWEEASLLKRIYQELLLLRTQDIRMVSDEVLRDWPEVVRGVLKIAKASTSDRIRLEAAEWLHQRIVTPALQERQSQGSKELNYANSDQSFNPTAIPDQDIEVIVKTKLPTVIDHRPGTGS